MPLSVLLHVLPGCDSVYQQHQAVPPAIMTLLVVQPRSDATAQDLFLQVPPAYKLVTVRNCTTGEVQISATICSACPASSFSFNSSNTACNICPANANCSGGANLVPLSQYWHSSHSSDHVISCPNNNACLGSRDELLQCKNASYMLKSGLTPVGSRSQTYCLCAILWLAFWQDVDRQ